MKNSDVKRVNVNYLTRWKTLFFGEEVKEVEEGVLNIQISSRKLLELFSNVSVSSSLFQTSRLLISSRFSVSPLSHLPKICDPISENVI